MSSLTLPTNCEMNILSKTNNYIIKISNTFANGTQFCGKYSTSNTITVSQNSLGKNVGFIYDGSDTTLYLYGEGETNNYYIGSTPLSNYRTAKKVFISPEITSLGNNLFHYIEMKSITIPNSVTHIGIA